MVIANLIPLTTEAIFMIVMQIKIMTMQDWAEAGHDGQAEHKKTCCECLTNFHVESIVSNR
jgi:hypothetical protein